MKENPIYSDLDLTFKPHPLTGDLVPRKNVDAVRRALKTAIFLDKFDIPFDATKKSNLKKILFEQAGQLTEISIRADIEWAFRSLEPRASLLKLDVELDASQQGYNITIWYNIKSLNIKDSFTFYAERVR